jgi:hypothetical protein
VSNGDNGVTTLTTGTTGKTGKTRTGKNQKGRPIAGRVSGPEQDIVSVRSPHRPVVASGKEAQPKCGVQDQVLHPNVFALVTRNAKKLGPCSTYSARSSVGLEQIREMATSGRLGLSSVRGQPIEAIHNDEFNLALLRLQIQTELLP